MNQDRRRDQEMPDRQSDMEQAEGSRTSEGERGSDDTRNRADNERAPRNSGGITNRPLDNERREQANVPERGHSQSER